MGSENYSLRVGAIAIGVAVLLRLFCGSFLGKMVLFFSQPKAVSTMLFLEAGMILCAPEATEATPTQPEEVALPCFAPEDASMVTVRNSSGKEADLEVLLPQPLTWQLHGDQPTVLILHSHASEGYADSAPEYRSLEETENMLAIGSRLESLLTQAGIGVIHDTAIHDYPSYNDSYSQSRASVRAYLEQYPSIVLVLDLHRDALEDSQGNQMGTTLTVNGQACAQLMMVVGTNGNGLLHPDWQSNLALAAKLHAQLERQQPGITRPMSLRKQRFNQDLSPGAMLIEVGAAGNTQAQALAAVEQLAAAIIALSHGTS